MLKIIQILIWFCIIPTFLGMLVINLIKKEKNNFIYSYVLGFILEFAIMEIITVTFAFSKMTLNSLIITFSSIVGILIVLSIFVNRKNLINFVKENFKKITKCKLSSVAVGVVILIQVLNFVIYTHIDDDDSFYVATATTAIETNTLYEYTALEGRPYYEIPSRYILSPFPMFTAVMSKLVDINPAIMAHTIFPIVLIPIYYMLFAIIANRLFKEEKESVNLFLIILSIINIWGNYSIRSTSSFLLLRIWQGKAILANILLPAIVLIFYDSVVVNSENKYSWILTIFAMFASSLLSEMGLALAPMLLMLTAIIFAIKDKKISYFVKSSISCVPCIAYLICYLIIH